MSKINLGGLNSTEHQKRATTVTAFEIDQGARYQGTTNHSARVV